ncbi:conserved hypothetical protein, membrane or secreted [Candidatus Magnetomorum sp. HK-1]|nr:conserved hypothetical protein, membrane or secreted [Candidatus Magnetomorum sp. HK-1]
MLKKKRIIAYSVLAVLILFCAFFLLPSSNQSKNQKKNITHLESITKEVKDGLKKTGMDKVTNYVINRAESMWSNDPFSDQKPAGPTSKKINGAVTSPDMPGRIRPVFTYSGYMEVGEKRMAIINGMEYELNEELEIKGYYVDTIEQNWVIIEDKKNQEKITVFFGNP